MATQCNGRTHTKLTGAADYDDAGFWDTKFATGQDIGEWLNPGEALIEAVLARESSPRVLHLGPGISKLGTKLREAFTARDWRGDSIVNVDFSAEAVRLGREVESLQDPINAMHWLQTDLRSWPDMSRLSPLAPFDIILDKSTSDAIATAPSSTFAPASLTPSVCPTVRETVDQHGDETTLSPVELLGLHLVPLTRKGTVWLTLSYSTMRYDNLRHLGEYWELVSRTPLKAPGGEASAFAYTPEVFHWIYVLERK